MKEKPIRDWRTQWHVSFANGTNADAGWAVCRLTLSGDIQHLEVDGRSMRYATCEQANAVAVSLGGVPTNAKAVLRHTAFGWPETTAQWKRVKVAWAEFLRLVSKR